MERPTCKTCPYWLLLDEECWEITVAKHEELYPDADTIGDCQRFPGPPIIEVHQSTDGGHGSQTMIQLLVPKKVEKFDFDWCGEHPDFPAYIRATHKALAV
jgi:hypothetical protein